MLTSLERLRLNFHLPPQRTRLRFSSARRKTRKCSPARTLTIFQSNSLPLALKKAGFNVVAVHTPENSMFSWSSESIFVAVSLRDNQFLRELLDLHDIQLESDLQNLLSQNRLSSHLEVISAKRCLG